VCTTKALDKEADAIRLLRSTGLVLESDEHRRFVSNEASVLLSHFEVDARKLWDDLRQRVAISP